MNNHKSKRKNILTEAIMKVRRRGVWRDGKTIKKKKI